MILAGIKRTTGRSLDGVADSLKDSEKSNHHETRSSSIVRAWVPGFLRTSRLGESTPDFEILGADDRVVRTGRACMDVRSDSPQRSGDAVR